MSFQASALLLSWVAILLLALVVSGLVRQVSALTAGSAGGPGRGIGPAAGTPAPDFRRLAPPSPGPLVLLFAGTDCRTCQALVAEAAGIVEAITGAGATTADAAGKAEAAGSAAEAGVAVRVLYPAAVPATAPTWPAGALVGVHGDAADLFGSYRVPATPFAVLVDRGGRVRRSVPLGSVDALRALLADAAGLTTPGVGR